MRGVSLKSEHLLPEGSEVARRFNLLLEKFPRADGEPWTGVEVEEATSHMVTGSYFSALKVGKLKRPGIRYLGLIADVMGFPFELWRIEPELWDEYLLENPARGGFRSPRPRQPVPRVPAGEELARLVNALFERKPARTGEPYAEEEVARRSRDRVSVGEIRLMRSGGQIGPPPEIKLLGISDVFGEPPWYWYVPSRPGWITDELKTTPRDPDRLSTDITEANLEGSKSLDLGEKRMLLAFIRLFRAEDVEVTNRSGVGSKVLRRGVGNADPREAGPESRANEDRNDVPQRGSGGSEKTLGDREREAE